MKELTAFEKIQNTRTMMITMTSDLSVAELNFVPESFQQSLIWHMGHVLATQQIVCYQQSGVSPTLGTPFINRYCSEAKRSENISGCEIDLIKNLLVTETDQLQKDYNVGLFIDFNEFKSIVYQGTVLKNIEQALIYLTFIDVLHLGYVIMIRNFVTAKNTSCH